MFILLKVVPLLIPYDNWVTLLLIFFFVALLLTDIVYEACEDQTSKESKSTQLCCIQWWHWLWRYNSDI